MGILDGNPKQEPLHYGEVYGAWTYLTITNQLKAKYDVLSNHAGDADLKKYIEEIKNKSLKRELTELENVLKANGVTLPPSPPERPTVNLEEIPEGARLSDPEIAATLTQDLAAGLVTCSQIMGQSLREDVAALFGKFHTEKAKDEAQLLRMVKDKGWLITPPLLKKQQEPAPV